MTPQEQARRLFGEHLLTDRATGLPYTSSYFGDLYDWEFYYDALVGVRVGMVEPIVGGLRIFLGHQAADGFIPRHVHVATAGEEDRYPEEATEHCKPFLAQAALELSRHAGSADWLSDDELKQLERYVRYWIEDRDLRGSGLSAWRSAPHSGADTQAIRMGGWGADRCEGTDLNAFLVREAEALASLATMKGNEALAGRAAGWASARAAAIEAQLWDEAVGFYFDRDAGSGESIRVMSASGFLPLWAGTSSPARAERLIAHLTDPAEFWSPYPIRSLSRQEASYTQFYEPIQLADGTSWLAPDHANWNGGFWPHWQHLIIEGVRHYGYTREADEMANAFHRLVQTAGSREWYDPETGDGCGLTGFWAGASLMGLLELES